MEINVAEFTHQPTKVSAIYYDGDPASAKLLRDNGWFDGTDQGHGKDNAGGFVVRGLVIKGTDQPTMAVQYDVVYPGDIVSKDVNGKKEVWDRDMFLKSYYDPHTLQVLTDLVEPIPPETPIPTGENPDAVSLENPDTAKIAAGVVEDDAKQKQYNELVANGMDPDDAKLEVWPMQ